jgi:hypothetical protein
MREQPIDDLSGICAKLADEVLVVRVVGHHPDLNPGLPPGAPRADPKDTFLKRVYPNE